MKDEYKKRRRHLTIAEWILYIAILIPMLHIMNNKFDPIWPWYAWVLYFAVCMILSYSTRIITTELRRFIRFEKEFWEDKTRQAKFKERQLHIEHSSPDRER